MLINANRNEKSALLRDLLMQPVIKRNKHTNDKALKRMLTDKVA